eukprot:snap_masked-scaffold385_size188773-processed-gene-0.18 protein:Tk10816 transcript:snap_masked-scaffold385_size188773-processed-gene-0.18-mRNA-1 annotation:"sugar fermentation stimulation protein"
MWITSQSLMKQDRGSFIERQVPLGDDGREIRSECEKPNSAGGRAWAGGRGWPKAEHEPKAQQVGHDGMNGLWNSRSNEIHCCELDLIPD